MGVPCWHTSGALIQIIYPIDKIRRYPVTKRTRQLSPLPRIIASPELPRVRDPHGAGAVREGRRVGHLAAIPPQELEQVAAARRVAEVRVHLVRVRVGAGGEGEGEGEG